jgi:hypothetical protein
MSGEEKMIPNLISLYYKTWSKVSFGLKLLLLLLFAKRVTVTASVLCSVEMIKLLS